MKKRVVITGMDAVSSIGCGLDAFWSGLKSGRQGIKPITRFNADEYSTRIAGEIPDFHLDEMPEFNKSKRYPRVAQYALYAAHHALNQSGLTPEERAEAATYIGTGLGGMPEMESIYQTFFSEGWKKVPALSVLRGMPNSIANHVAIAFGLKGKCLTISNACVSSADAIGLGYEAISQGKTSIALCGGTESLIWETTMVAWCRLRVMSTDNDNPGSSCKPFALDRDGMVMADGAGMLVLEDYDHARARGATIYGEIIGYGSSCDAHHITAPDSAGQVRAIYQALDDARLSAGDVHYINAHGTATQMNDLVETQSIKAVFGERAYEIPVSAQKAMTGHSIGAAGALEIIATAMSLREDILIPTINLNQPDPDCDLDYVANEARMKKIDIAMSNHFAFGGANSVLLLRKCYN